MNNIPTPHKGEKQLLAYLEQIPAYSPKEISAIIHEQCYIGQETAVKAISLMAFRHVIRLKRLYLQQVPPEQLPPKTNMLFVGPTGCGKTYLVELLFKEILKLPTVVVDMTCFSETGYVGQDVISILTRLVYAANFSTELASIGVVCLDEFDKIASGQNNAVFAGAGTTKDVSGLGVQRELLKMLETTVVHIPLEITHASYGPKSVVSTKDVPFIACGAFSGLKGLIENKGEHIGFGREPLSGEQGKVAASFTVEDVEMVKNFINYGFLPELIGRFKRIVPFHALEESQLEAILMQSIFAQYKNELKLCGIELEVRPEVLKDIVKQSFKKETGARGIEATFIRYLEDATYEAYSAAGVSRLLVMMEDGQIRYRLD